jgi:hypothetical protein
MIEIRSATTEDIPSLGELPLREADQIEIRAALGKDPNQALMECARVADEVNLILEDGEIIGVFGVAVDPMGTYAAPWFVCSDKAYNHKIRLLRFSRFKVAQWLGTYNLLFNYVDPRHTASVEWLEWLGFTVQRTTRVNLHDPHVDFHPFYMEKKEEPCVHRS